MIDTTEFRRSFRSQIMHDLCDEIDALRTALTKAEAERDALRNELCLKCGRYREAHKGACDGCRWKRDA